MSAEGIKVLQDHLIKLKKEKDRLEFKLNERAPISELHEVRKQFVELTKEKISKEILAKMKVLTDKEGEYLMKIRKISNRDSLKIMDEIFAIEKRIRQIEDDLSAIGLRNFIRKGCK